MSFDMSSRALHRLQPWIFLRGLSTNPLLSWNAIWEMKHAPPHAGNTSGVCTSAVTWALAFRDSNNTQPHIEKAAELVVAIIDFFWFERFTARLVSGWINALAIQLHPSLYVLSCFKSLAG
jgi:hypothetical protein